MLQSVRADSCILDQRYNVPRERKRIARKKWSNQKNSEIQKSRTYVPGMHDIFENTTIIEFVVLLLNFSCTQTHKWAMIQEWMRCWAIGCASVRVRIYPGIYSQHFWGYVTWRLLFRKVSMMAEKRDHRKETLRVDRAESWDRDRHQHSLVPDKVRIILLLEGLHI